MKRKKNNGKDGSNLDQLGVAFRIRNVQTSYIYLMSSQLKWRIVFTEALPHLSTWRSLTTHMGPTCAESYPCICFTIHACLWIVWMLAFKLIAEERQVGCLGTSWVGLARRERASLCFLSTSCPPQRKVETDVGPKDAINVVLNRTDWLI